MPTNLNVISNPNTKQDYIERDMGLELSILKNAKHEAISFLYKCVRGGLAHSLDVKNGAWVKPYPEVTGYLVSLFSKLHPDVGFAKSMANKLIGLQHQTGGWKSFYGDKLFTFDTAQIGKGLLDIFDLTQEEVYLEAAKSAATFILFMQIENGGFFPIFDIKKNERISYGKSWGDGFSPINCKTSELLISLENSGHFDCKKAVEAVCEWTTDMEQIDFTHPGAYSLEGLIAGGFSDVVRDRLYEYFLPRLTDEGFIPYGPGCKYAYVSGSAQLGILFAKVGMFGEAVKIFNWCRLVQEKHSSGGLFQYANSDGSLNSEIHSEINSWGTKYYVELIELLEKNTNIIFVDEQIGSCNTQIVA